MINTEDLIITVEALPEDTPVRGNALASGDDAIDKKEEDRIIRDLEWNEWAWCVAKVTAEFHGLTATEYLGACSYESSTDFIQNSGYYKDMVETCREDIEGQAAYIGGWIRGRMERDDAENRAKAAYTEGSAD